MCMVGVHIYEVQDWETCFEFDLQIYVKLCTCHISQFELIKFETYVINSTLIV